MYKINLIYIHKTHDKLKPNNDNFIAKYFLYSFLPFFSTPAISQLVTPLPQTAPVHIHTHMIIPGALRVDKLQPIKKNTTSGGRVRS